MVIFFFPSDYDEILFYTSYSHKKKKEKKNIYIYIYIERERERASYGLRLDKFVLYSG